MTEEEAIKAGPGEKTILQKEPKVEQYQLYAIEHPTTKAGTEESTIAIRAVGDLELDAMTVIVEALKGLDREQIERVLSYMGARFLVKQE